MTYCCLTSKTPGVTRIQGKREQELPKIVVIYQIPLSPVLNLATNTRS